MPRIWTKFARSACLLTSLSLSTAYAQFGEYPDDSSQPSSSSGSSSSTKSAEDDENLIKIPKDTNPPVPKTFTKSDVQKACSKYQGKLISVYGEIYKLQNCKRHLIQDSDEVLRLTRQGNSVVEVNAQDVAAIPVGDHWEHAEAKDRPCASFHKKYITFSYTDIYYVENCLKRLIPDYETFLQHRKERGAKNSEILALNSKEFHTLKHGRDISSIIDKEFSKLLDGSAGVDVIPIDEACRGVEGKIVTFYSKMYKIEKCRKREIEASSFTMQRKLADSKLIELKPEQWLSMPDGKPWSSGK